MNFECAEPEWAPAVIAGAYQTGMLGVRALKRRNVRVACFDCNESVSGFRSVYGPAHLCPDPDTDPDRWLHFMEQLSIQWSQKPALIPSSDKFVSAIAKHFDFLSNRFILSPGIALQGVLAEKHKQYELADRYGMPMPHTKFVRSISEINEFSSEAAFPCIVKPIHFREWQKFPNGHPLSWKKVSIARTKKELNESYMLAASANPNVIVQEVIQGADPDKRVYLSCYDAKSKRIANAMFRELRCDPIGFGPASISEPVIDPEVDSVCDNFLRSIGYVGICEIEVKRDKRDGKVKLIEANPRLSGGGDAAPYSGVDICWLHYLDLIGQHVVPVAPLGNDFRHVVLRADSKAIPAYWRAGLLSWREVLRSYRPPLAFFDLDRHDWRYSAETFYVSARLLMHGIFCHQGKDGSS